MRVMGIETSCDETAVAVIEAPAGTQAVGRILSNTVYSQLAEHRRFGGVVPEIAARAHLERIDGLVAQALDEAGLGLADLDGIAATGGPGLIGGVMVGVMTAKALAFAHEKPFIAVNHLEGHALSVRLTEPVAFPYLLLLVSGGHCQLLTVRGPGDFTRLGTTIDDAAGECFDKTAKLLGLGFPGGPAVERAAVGGDPRRFALPRPMWRKPGCDFSFSGLKTAVRLAVEKLPADDPQAIADLCASFQRTVGDVFADRCANALALAPSSTLVVAGGVAANVYLRGRLEEIAASHGATLVAPPVRLCTDNGAMIAWAGAERLRLGQVDTLDFRPRPRWPLDPAAANRM
ncbi:tRNA (adenosine(37)-N6)-threonylcarbamoyltransferase complex transferase subunit TsaD [Reyranella sp. MMS21-HV4-11]|jgi:N6-L-threonylcarbamoyladenine synthase|uniref:tRNA N6-adenosine threonylcarbamoyltransferase n=1 Tax=Reyranella humidisoli TaxID=2849149 RepID=A0ABS6IID7_9HYPH|nr:tRNA (adenosine(37)-N6)-threonylcarbamoyltransferase complex transferase subunit TsaD [Reyranella sp. MMS21-HV4-11]MBU8873649.1 tRNA (adenosine(37)-N6)-threonylcarbamoyltransferase complex transferase subunit TsaD [Reyranella sp. MMS21-HV4-11]